MPSTTSNTQPAAASTPAPAASPAAPLTTAQRRQAAIAAQLAAGKQVQQVPPAQVAGAPTRGGAGKGAPAVAKVQRVRAGRPKPTAALLAVAATAKGLRRNTAPSNTAAQARAAAAYVAAAQVVHVARRHNGLTLAGVHYAMRKVATGKWLVQQAPTAAYVPAPSAPVLGVGTNLGQCTAIAAAHRATSPKGAAKGPSRAAKPRKASSKAKPQPQAAPAPTQAAQAPQAPAAAQVPSA